jgi:hypothetical protein
VVCLDLVAPDGCVNCYIGEEKSEGFWRKEKRDRL